MGETRQTEWFYDCPKCGEIGRIQELQDHPTRPVPDDIGFCPHCGGEVDELLTRDQISVVLVEYGEDPDAFIAGLATTPSAASL